MFFLIFIVVLIFLFPTFLGSLPVHISNPFFAYIFFQLNFLLQHFLFFCIGFCAIFFLFIRKQKFDRGDILDKNYYLSFFQTIAVVIIGSFIAFILLVLTAWIELNSFALLTDINPATLGIVTNSSAIYNSLLKNNRPPIIIASDSNPQKKAISIATAISGSANFYGDTILSGIPDFLILPVKKFTSSLLYIDNTLIVTEINQTDIQRMSPLIGYLFVSSYFPTRHIKSFPHASVLSSSQFVSYQTADIKEKLTRVTVDIQKMEDGIASLSAAIQKDNDAITANGTSQADSLKQQNVQYDKCLSTGTYVSGTFHPTYTKSDCQKILDLWNPVLDSLGQQETNLQQQLQKDTQQLKDYQYYDTFFKAQKEIMAITSSTIPDELGVFQPPNVIKVVIANKSAHAIADYFETLCHEYLHYASYVPGKRFDSSFFEEGLTEYFARRTIQDTLQIDTNIAYPAQVRIIKEITNRIAEPDLADLYFSKDQIGLEKALNLAYGDNFYQNNITLFDTLQYTSDPQQVLQLANTIMKKIGGQPLKEQDLFSTQSNL